MGYPINILNNKEKQVLLNLFNLKENNDEALKKKIAKLLLPVGGFLQSSLSYDEFLNKLASKRALNISHKTTLFDKEQYILKNIFSQELDSLSEEEKIKLNKQLEAAAKEGGLSKSQISSITSLTTIGLAQASGFGVYLLASSTVGAISGLVGVSLPFAFYTAMSSVINIAIGPVGFILACIPLYKTFKNVRSLNDLKDKFSNIWKNSKTLFKGNYELAEIAFKYMASLRLIKTQEIKTTLQKENDNAVIVNAKVNAHQVLITNVQLKIDELKAEQEKYMSEKLEFSNQFNHINQNIQKLEDDYENILNPKNKKEVENLEKKVESIKPLNLTDIGKVSKHY